MELTAQQQSNIDRCIRGYTGWQHHYQREANYAGQHTTYGAIGIFEDFLSESPQDSGVWIQHKEATARQQFAEFKGSEFEDLCWYFKGKVVGCAALQKALEAEAEIPPPETDEFWLNPPLY